MTEHTAHAVDPDPEGDARSWWEARYAGVEGVWSGRVNAVLAAVVASLPDVASRPDAGRRALDLGCGEGGNLLEPGVDVLYTRHKVVLSHKVPYFANCRVYDTLQPLIVQL